MWITYSTTKALTPTAVALGNFDGIHCGHQQVIQPVLTLQRQENFVSSVTQTARTFATVVTFHPHPQEFFSGQSRALLTPMVEKVQQLQTLGVEQLVLLPFDRELAALTPQEFVEQILVRQLQAQQISVGQDFCFGKQRSGNATDLQAIAATFGIPVNIVPLHTCEGKRISSSAIRQALEQRDLPQAKTLLGRAYTLTGLVIQGQQLGRTIGFPTANLQLPPAKFLPPRGVYAVRVFLAEGMTTEIDLQIATEVVAPLLNSLAAVPGVMNIGNRPTVSGMHQSVEVHLLDWLGDLYGKTITVQLEKFLRPEQKFASLEALKAQIADDCVIARAVLAAEQPVVPKIAD